MLITALSDWAGRKITPNGPGMAVGEQREELERVLHSAQFRRAPKLQRFLALVCQYHFENRPHEINEYLIATEAFGKGADFDPGQDSLVRVQAREARRRLREYYQNEGKKAAVILDIPVGSYAPVFVPAGGAAPVPRRPTWTAVTIAALGCAVVLLSARLWFVASHPVPAQAAGTASPMVAHLWNRFLDSDVATVLVLSNPDVGECADTPPPGAPKETPCPDEYTGMGEAVAVNLISGMFQSRHKPLLVKQSRMVTEDDVKRYNLILLGGKRVNAWTARLGPDLTLTPDAASTPQHFETAFDGKTGQLISDRGLIALRRHPSTGHWLLFLYGKHTQGTHAAAEGSTNERFLSQLQWPGTARAMPDSFHVLIGVTVTDGMAEGPVPVALRVP